MNDEEILPGRYSPGVSKEHIQREKELDERASLLVPVTLANVDDKELGVLRQLLEFKTRLQPGKRMAPSTRSKLEMEQAQLLDEPYPVVKEGEGKGPFDVPRAKRQRRQHYAPWRSRLTLHLRRAVAKAKEINGKKPSMKVLEQERAAVLDILDLIVEINSLTGLRQKRAHREELVAQLRSILNDRIELDDKLAFIEISLDDKKDRLLVTRPLKTGDLGQRNTRCLLRLFDDYRFSSFGRCKLDNCGRFYVPGAEGRRRTKGVLFCSDSCKRTWTNLQQKS